MNKKTGLILEGGAMRGLFTAGVIDVFMEKGIKFDGAVGVSAGAAFGCNIKSNQIGRVIRYNKKYCRDKRFCSFYSLLTTGDIYGAKFCYYDIPKKLDPFDDKAYQENKMEFHIVCTDVNTGKAVYRKCDHLLGDNMEWIRGSASMPLVSRIVKTKTNNVLDGGVADSIPLKYFEGQGFNRNVLVLTRPITYRKTPNKSMAIAKLRYRKYPNLLNAMKNRHIMYNETLDYIFDKEKKGEILVIRPDEELPLKHMEKDAAVLEKVYNLGRKAAIDNIDRIKSFLEK